MRVIHLIDSAGVYGAEKVLLDLVEALGAIGVDSEIGSLGKAREHQKPIERECGRLGIPCRSIRFSPGFNVLAGRRILEDIEREDFDLVHAHGYKPDILFGFLLGSRRRTPMVTTVHGWTETRRFSKMGLYQALDKLSWHFIDRVVAVSDSSPAYGLDKLNDKVITIENGISPQDDKPTELLVETRRRISRFCERGTCVGVVSRLSREKGIHTLLQAIAGLKMSGINIGVVIVGDGEEANKIERQITLDGLSDRVLMTGYVPSASRLIGGFDILAIPSLTEGLPITLLEAMYCGVPVVASGVGQIPAVLEEGACGVIVNVGDPDALARGIMTLVHDEKYRDSLVARASKRVRTRYAAGNMAERYKTVYLELLARGRPAI